MRHGRKMLRLAAGAVVGAALSAAAGGGPQNVLVVVNDRDRASVEAGRYYMEKRGLAPRQLCRLRLPSSEPSIPAALFEEHIRRPIEAHIEAEGLARQIDFLAVCWSAPTRVSDSESITAALAFGFQNAPGAPPCALIPGTSNAYAFSERAFSRATGGPGRPAYLAMLLSAPTPEETRRLVDRSVAADGTAPDGTFYLLKPPSDPARNIRYKLFDEFDFQARFLEGFPRRVFAEQNAQGNLRDVMGYQTGISSYPDWFWATNAYRPGAIADHLTSFGGMLPTPSMGHSSVFDWIRAGASASYGTVSEPCNFPEKFPHPLVFLWYARGFNLAESYWMSVAHPHQGLFVGDPLMAPYARPPLVTVSGAVSGQTVSGVVTVRVTAVGTPERPVAAIDLYLDELWTATLTNVTPKAWNEIWVDVDGTAGQYILRTADDLCAAADGIARDLRRQNPMLNAIAFGDRVVLMDGRIGKPGATTRYGARVEAGLGPPPALSIRALTPAFMDSTYPARKYLLLRGPAQEGDAVECRITVAAGTVVTARVAAAEGEAATSVVARLERALRDDPLLGGEEGVRLANRKSSGEQVEFSLEASRPGATGMALLLEYHILPAQAGTGLGPPVAYRGRLGDTIDLLSSRGMLQLACGRETLEAEAVLDTAAHPAGPHALRFVARDGTAVQTQGHALLPLVFRHADPAR